MDREQGISQSADREQDGFATRRSLTSNFFCFFFPVLFQIGCFNLSFCFCAYLIYFHTLISLFVNKLLDDDNDGSQLRWEDLWGQPISGQGMGQQTIPRPVSMGTTNPWKENRPAANDMGRIFGAANQRAESGTAANHRAGIYGNDQSAHRRRVMGQDECRTERLLAPVRGVTDLCTRHSRRWSEVAIRLYARRQSGALASGIALYT